VVVVRGADVYHRGRGPTQQNYLMYQGKGDGVSKNREKATRKEKTWGSPCAEARGHGFKEGIESLLWEVRPGGRVGVGPPSPGAKL